MLINLLIREIKLEFEREQYASYEPLRHEVFLSHIQPEIHTVEWYQEQVKLDTYPKVGDENFRSELICCDCVLESADPQESALDFFVRAENIASYQVPDFAKSLLLPIIGQYIKDEKVALKLSDDLLKIAKSLPSKGGNLYSSCVPKEKFDESCYLSAPYGIKWSDAHPEENQEIDLDQLQRGDFSVRYGLLYRLPTPQIRILSDKIQPKDGYFVMMNSTLSDEELKRVEEAVYLSVHAALTNYRIEP